MLRSIGLTPRLVLLTLLVLWPTLTAVVLILGGEHVDATRSATTENLRAQARLVVDLIRGYRLSDDSEALRQDVYEMVTAWAEAAGRDQADQAWFVLELVRRYAVDADPAVLHDEVLDALEVEGRSAEALLEQRIGRIQDLLGSYRRQGDLEALRREVFHAIVKERGDVPGLALFEMDGDGRLVPLALERRFREELAAGAMDREAWKQNAPRNSRLERSQLPHQAIAVPFEHDGRRLLLHLEMAEPEGGRSAWRFVETGILAGLIASAAVAVLLAMFTKLAVARPIGLLARAMSEMRGARLGRTLPVRNEDQLGGLIRTFNDMSLDLRRAEEKNQGLMRELQDFNRELESRILEATRDLKQKNVELLASEERLYTVQQEVSQLERLASLGQLSSTVAHELSTPLNVVLGHLDLLVVDTSLGDAARNRVHILVAQVNRLVGILKEMLTAVRVPDPVITEVPLRSLVEETIRFLLPSSASRSIEVIKHLPDEEVRALADRNQAQQVILNIVSNAIEATPAKGMVEVDLVPARELVVVRVRDSGPGILPELMQRIFEPFFTTKALGGGTGLGLAISSDIMRRNGGSITVANHPQGGAVFEITFRTAGPQAGAVHDRDSGRQHAHR